MFKHEYKIELLPIGNFVYQSGYEQTASHFLKVNCQNALDYLEYLNISKHSFPLLHVKKYVFWAAKASWNKQWCSKWMFGGNVGCNEKEWCHPGLRMSLHTYSGLFPGRQIINDSLPLPIQLCKHLFLPSWLFVCTGGGKVESENPFSSTPPPPPF